MPNLWDGGLITRWLILPPGQLVINLTFFTLLAYFYINFSKLKKEATTPLINYLLFIAFASSSFIFFTTFFIVDLNPLVLGQTLRPRFLVILLPLAYIFVFIFIFNFKLKIISRNKLIIGYTILALIALLSYRSDLYRKSLKEWNLYFRDLALNLPSTICVPNNENSDDHKWIVQKLWYFPNSLRNENFHQIDGLKPLKTEMYWVRGNIEDCDLDVYNLRIEN